MPTPVKFSTGCDGVLCSFFLPFFLRFFGDVDFLQLIDNWRQLLRLQLAERRAEVALRKALASLERSIGGNRLLITAAPEPIQPANEADDLPESRGNGFQPPSWERLPAAKARAALKDPLFER